MVPKQVTLEDARSARPAISTTVLAVLIIVVIGIAAVVGFVALSQKGGSSSSTSSTVPQTTSTSSQTSFQPSTTSSTKLTSTSTQTQSLIASPVTIVNGVDIYGNFTNLSAEFEEKCVSVCTGQNNFSYAEIDSISFIQNVGVNGFTFGEYNVTTSRTDQSGTFVPYSTEYFYLNVTNPDSSYDVRSPCNILSCIDGNKISANYCCNVGPLADVVAIESLIPRTYGIPSNATLSQNTTTFDGTQLELRTYQFSASHASIANDNGTAVVTEQFATFEGTSITFGFAWKIVVTNPQSNYTSVIELRLLSLSRS